MINFDLCISARYVDPSIEASAIVAFNHFSPIHLEKQNLTNCNCVVTKWRDDLVGANATVVRTLRSREPFFWPPIGVLQI